MEFSQVICNSQKIEQIASVIIDGGTPDFNGDQLAAQYAVNAAEVAGYGFSRSTLSAHLDSLSEAGAEFDFQKSLKLANRYAKHFDPAQNMNILKDYIFEQTKIELDFRRYVYLENHHGFNPTYRYKEAEAIADAIIRIFNDSNVLNRTLLLDEMRTKKLKTLLQNLIDGAIRQNSEAGSLELD